MLDRECITSTPGAHFETLVVSHRVTARYLNAGCVLAWTVIIECAIADARANPEFAADIPFFFLWRAAPWSCRVPARQPSKGATASFTRHHVSCAEIVKIRTRNSKIDSKTTNLNA